MESDTRIEPHVVTVEHDCPLCGAKVGSSCREPDGRKRSPHVVRAKRAYRAADVYNPAFNPHGSRVPDIYADDPRAKDRERQ